MRPGDPAAIVGAMATGHPSMAADRPAKAKVHRARRGVVIAPGPDGFDAAAWPMPWPPSRVPVVAVEPGQPPQEGLQPESTRIVAAGARLLYGRGPGTARHALLHLACRHGQAPRHAGLRPRPQPGRRPVVPGRRRAPPGGRAVPRWLLVPRLGTRPDGRAGPRPRPAGHRRLERRVPPSRSRRRLAGSPARTPTGPPTTSSPSPPSTASTSTGSPCSAIRPAPSWPCGWPPGAGGAWCIPALAVGMATIADLERPAARTGGTRSPSLSAGPRHTDDDGDPRVALADASPRARVPIGVPQILAHAVDDEVVPPPRPRRTPRRPGRPATRSPSSRSRPVATSA